MLTTLKTLLERAESGIETELDLASAQTDDDIKSMFLDDPGAVVVGAENDPIITALIEKIPASDDLDSISAAEIAKLSESAIPETRIHGDAMFENDSLILDKGDDDEPEGIDGDLNDMTEGMWDPDSEENIDDKITGEDFSEFDECLTPAT